MPECAVCKSARREEIERNLFAVAPSETPTEELEKLAKEYNVEVSDLQRHALFHSPLGCGTHDSIVRQIKMREADMLAEATADYMSTLKLVGDKIRTSASYDDGMGFSRAITKPIVELYTGCGAEMRNNVRVIADINQQLNGPKDEGTAGLRALAEALTSSRKNGCEDA